MEKTYKIMKDKEVVGNLLVQIEKPKEIEEAEKRLQVSFEDPIIITDYETDSEYIKNLLEDIAIQLDLIGDGERGRVLYETKKKYKSLYTLQGRLFFEGYSLEEQY